MLLKVGYVHWRDRYFILAVTSKQYTKQPCWLFLPRSLAAVETMSTKQAMRRRYRYHHTDLYLRTLTFCVYQRMYVYRSID
jgi:hypothetical protein